MELPDDIEQVVARQLSVADGLRVRATLRALLEWEHGCERVVRCVVHLGEGDVAKIEHYAHAARADPRDVIWWAEYDGGEQLVRDFTRPMSLQP